MKIPVYAALLVAAVLMFVSTLKNKNRTADRKIDLIAYGFMVIGLAVLFVTCIAEEITGGPLI